MSAIARGIKFLHCPPYPTAILHDGHLIARDSLFGNVRDVFRVMEEGYGIVVGPEQDDFAIEQQKSLQRRIGTESIIPRLARKEVLRLLTPADETGNMVIHNRTWKGPEEFDEYPVFAI